MKQETSARKSAEPAVIKQETIAHFIRTAVWNILSRLRTSKKIEMKVLMDMVLEEVYLVFGKERLRLDYFIASLLVQDSNIAVMSDGYQLFVTYAHLIRYDKQARSVEEILGKRASNAEHLRRTAWRELRLEYRVAFVKIRHTMWQAVGREVNLRIQSLLIKKACFVAVSERATKEKPGGIFITTFDRVSV